MVRKGWVAALLALVATAGACGRGGVPSADAAGAVQGFLASVQAGDQQDFEAAIDRPALRSHLRRQLIEVARANGLEVDGGPTDLALDRMIGPAAFRLVQAETGAALAAAPSRAQVGGLLKQMDRGRVCLHDATSAERCLLTFARVSGGRGGPGGFGRPAAWRLVEMPAQDIVIQVGPDPTPRP